MIPRITRWLSHFPEPCCSPEEYCVCLLLVIFQCVGTQTPFITVVVTTKKLHKLAKELLNGMKRSGFYQNPNYLILCPFLAYINYATLTSQHQ